MIHTIGIFYFSGTGNTQRVATLFQDALQAGGADVELFAIEDILKGRQCCEFERFDLMGIGYTVHAWNAPQIVFDFITTHLPKSKGKKTFLFKCPGDPIMQGGATAMLRSALNKRGYIVFHESMIVMPANVLIRFDPELEKQLYHVAITKVADLSQEILNGERRLQSNSLLTIGLSWLFSKGETHIGARIFGRRLTTTPACTLCGKCVRECPTGNISVREQHIQFGWRCAFCMRCIYRCPEHAIKAKSLSFFVLKEGYSLQPILDDPTVQEHFLSPETKGMFARFYRYVKS